MFKETEVDECEIIVIGHLKWNPYFGEKKKIHLVGIHQPVHQF